jgi:hypothetical protein
MRKENMTKSNSSFTEAQVSAINDFANQQDSGLITNDDVKALVKDKVFAGKTVAMLRGKVVSMKRYKTQEKATSKTSEGVVRKVQFVSAIENMLSIQDGRLATLEKASKADLKTLTDALIALGDKA